MLLSPARMSLCKSKHPVTKEVLGKPTRYRSRTCWKDRPHRWEIPVIPATGHGHGLPSASQSAYFDPEQEPELDPEQAVLEEDMAFLDDDWEPASDL